MGYPRRLYVQPGAPGIYHCVSRCVRRAFLCGEDPLTGRSFEHRKPWIEQRILELGRFFAVAVHAYAVMSNHVHVVVEVDPSAAMAWPNEEVARRWLALFHGDQGNAAASIESRIERLVSQNERIDTLRQRLGDLSWFMRCLNEPVARRANREDGCTGRFWEGRFKCQTLLDDPAVLACMVYVDLNPVRAGTAPTPETSEHTSLRRRCDTDALAGPLAPVAASIPGNTLPLTTATYLELVDWTGRALHPGERGAVPGHAPAILTRMALRPTQWICRVPATESGYWRVIGNAESIAHQAQQLGQRWLRGLGFARRLDTVSDTS
jgi:REP element-mobilizing transposase RayT